MVSTVALQHWLTRAFLCEVHMFSPCLHGVFSGSLVYTKTFRTFAVEYFTALYSFVHQIVMQVIPAVMLCTKLLF